MMSNIPYVFEILLFSVLMLMLSNAYAFILNSLLATDSLNSREF